MQSPNLISSGGVTVRHGEERDVDWLLSQLKKFSTFYGTKRSLYGSDDHVREILFRCIGDHILLIAERAEAGPVGFISGFVGPHPYNPSIRSLTETAWWVDEDHRGSRAGLLLFNAFVAWGRSNVDWIVFAIEDHSPVNPDILVRRGFRLQERNFLMEVV